MQIMWQIIIKPFKNVKGLLVIMGLKNINQLNKHRLFF